MQVEANGIGIEVETHGPDDAPAFLLIRGLGTQLVQWPGELVDALVGGGYRVVLFDNRDVGLSQKFDDTSYDLRDMAADAIGVLDALSIGQAHVMGISMGGMIAQWMAIHWAERCRSLVSVMSSSGAPDLPGPTPEAIEALTSVPEHPDDRECVIAHGMRTQRVFESPEFALDDAELREYIASAYDRCYCPDGVRRQMTAVMASQGRADDLARVTRPTLVVHGADDPLIPLAAGEDTARRVPGARLEVVEGMGHDVTRHNAPVLARLLLEHARAVASDA